MIKNPPANVGDAGSSARLPRSPGGGDVNPLQYSCVESSMDRVAGQVTVCEVVKESDTI